MLTARLQIHNRNWPNFTTHSLSLSLFFLLESGRASLPCLARGTDEALSAAATKHHQRQHQNRNRLGHHPSCCSSSSSAVERKNIMVHVRPTRSFTRITPRNLLFVDPNARSTTHCCYTRKFVLEARRNTGRSLLRQLASSAVDLLLLLLLSAGDLVGGWGCMCNVTDP